MNKTKLLQINFSNIYNLYLEKITRKGRTKAELNQVITWLIGENWSFDTDKSLNEVVAQAEINPSADKIKGVICGVRVEDIEDPEMQKIRYLDKLVDELARGKKMEKILRA